MEGIIALPAGRLPAFDSYVVVDWSAHAKPKTGADSAWWAALAWYEGVLRLEKSENPPTRVAAEHGLRRLLREALREDKSVLIGFDFPYGYPAGFVRMLGLDGEPWRAAWELLASEIRDEQALGENNRFEVAGRLNLRMGHALFWGHPSGRATPGLTPTKPLPPRALPELRLTEAMAKGAKSAWQLSGRGSVGSQALMGLPTLHRLMADPVLAPYSTVWPFETGPSLPPRPAGRGRIVHAEIYSSLIPVEPSPGQVRDEAQVLALARWLGKLDADDELSDYFEAPSRLPKEELTRVVEEEGWILGVRP